MLFQVTPTLSNPSTAEDTDIMFIYLKNESDFDMIIEGVDFRLNGESQTEVIEVQAGDGEVPVGGVSIAPANLNLGSANQADGIFLASNEITEVSQGTPMFRFFIESSNTTSPINFEQDLIVPKNNVITLWAKHGGEEITGMIIFYYKDISKD